jgi:hypothetical protein
MRKKDFSTLGRKLLDRLHGYHVKGALILAEPAGPILRGIAFDGSSHSKTSFYMHVFFQPLCVPAEHIHFTFGFRITDTAGMDGWESARPNLLADISKSLSKQALPFLQKVVTLDGAAETLDAMRSNNTHVKEASAFCRILTGDTAMALKQLEKITGFNREIEWQDQQASRIEWMIQMLRADPEAAKHQLRTWQTETASTLGVT